MKDNTLEYKGYIANIAYSPDEEVFYGKIFGINDLVTFEADTAKALKPAFIEAVEDYLETCAEVGKDPDKVFKGVFNVRIPSSLHKDAANMAVKNQLSLNDFVSKAIHFAISHQREMERELTQS